MLIDKEGLENVMSVSLLRIDPDGWYCCISMNSVGDEVMLGYCAGDREVEELNRLRLVAVDREWLHQKF